MAKAEKLDYDVVVAGCGVAGLSAACAALDEGARVAVLERAPVEERGGNTRWTEAFMRMKSLDEVSDDFESHFMANQPGHLDPSLIDAAARDYGEWPAIVKALSFTDPEVIGTFAADAGPTLRWLSGLGIRFDEQPGYLLTQCTTRIGPVGGGLQLVETLAALAESRGAEFHYETTAESLLQDEDGEVLGLRAMRADGAGVHFRGRGVVLACGGFEGNPEMMARYMGERARWLRPVARGGYYNKGEGIRMALAANAAPNGDFTEYHAEPIDPRSGVSEPIVFIFPYGLLVDREGRRFVDEASWTVDAIYEAITRRIARLPGGVAYTILDSKVDDVPAWRRAVRSDVPEVRADSIAGLAQALGIEAKGLEATVAAYNAACRPGEFKPLERDGLSTIGLEPPHSNWARPLDRPPYLAWPVSAANCFTFGGLKCDARARVLSHSGAAIPGLWAAGETMGLYFGAYTGATSVMRGAVFGRIAGREAARRARANR